jgi:hypothetical protein
VSVLPDFGENMPKMLASGLFRAQMFVACVAFVYCAAAIVLVRRLLRGGRVGTILAGRPQPRVTPGPPAVWFERVVLALAAAGILCMAHGFFIEPYWLEINRLKIATPKLRAGSVPIRLVHITDFHSDPSPRLESRLPGVIAREKPDLVVFTGDTVNSAEALPVFRRCLRQIAAIAPTFAIKGNWDAAYWGKLDLFGDTGVTALGGQAVPLRLHGSDLWIVGASPVGHPSVQRALRAVPPGTLTVLLCHSPDEIEEVADRSVDLYLAGHTHGGQVALPLFGPLVTLSRFGNRYARGLYKVGGTWLYVNRGIGMEGGVPRVRFWARPEIAVIDLIPP